MRIDRLHIENFKKFEMQDFDFHPKFTLLVGENGAGKTTILDALSVAAGVWLVNPPDVTLGHSRRIILRNEIRLASGQVGDRTQFREMPPVVVQATGNLGGRNIDWTRINFGPNIIKAHWCQVWRVKVWHKGSAGGAGLAGARLVGASERGASG